MITIEIIRKQPDQVGFAVHPRRWVVERFFGRISWDRRLWKNPEATDYRLLVVGGRMIAAALRSPAQVVGLGVRTVEQLVDELNQDPRRGDTYPKLMEKIQIDGAGIGAPR